MKTLIILPIMLALGACTDSINQSASGAGQIINAGEDVASSVTATTPVAAPKATGTNAEGECSVQSRADGIC